MDYPIHTDTISMELSISYFMGSQVKISIKNYAPLSQKIVFILANSTDPDILVFTVCERDPDILVFTVCENTFFIVSRMKRINGID